MGSTVAPNSLLAARGFIMSAFGITDPNAVGIKGDAAHANSGSSYHLGEGDLRPDSYTIVESPRDRRGLSDDASAIDIGKFKIVRDGRTHTLPTFSVWLVGQCRMNAPDTLDIREVIYSPDGKVVRRYDREGIRDSGPASHLEHTHVSYYRDSTKRDKLGLYRRYVAEVIEGDGLDMDDAKFLALLDKGLKAWTEQDPDTGKATYRIGGALRTQNKREQSRYDALRGMLVQLAGAVSELAADAGIDTADLQKQIASLSKQVDGVDEAVLAGLGSLTAEEQANALRALLGGNAAAVGRILASGAQ